MVRVELQKLGAQLGPAVPGGVTFSADSSTLARIHVEAGLVLDLWVHVARFAARTFEQLERRVTRMPWVDLLPAEAPIVVTVHSRRSRLYHSGAIRERLERFIGAPTGSGPEAIEVRARLERDHATLSIVTTGEPLNRRGYRLEAGKAPLREDIARALLIQAGWPNAHDRLIDPMCGSGTLLIEGALLACDRAPGLNRAFAGERLPFLGAEPFERARTEARQRIRLEEASRILGGDRDHGAVEAAKRNAARAGVAVSIEPGALASIPDRVSAAVIVPRGAAPRAAGLWASNPPFGQRVSGGRDLRPLYQTIGRALAQLGPEWHLALAARSVGLARTTGISFHDATAVSVGGKTIHLLS